MEDVECWLYPRSCFHQYRGGAVLAAPGWECSVTDGNAVDGGEDGAEAER